jgi:NAD+ kinase
MLPLPDAARGGARAARPRAGGSIEIVFRKIGLIAKQADAAVRDALGSILAVLNRHQIDVVLDVNSAEVHPTGQYRRVTDELAADRDLVIAVGGDGTLLRAAKLTFPRKVPLMGINLGRLGFLADLSPAQAASGLEAVLAGNFSREERCVLECTIQRGDTEVATGYGLNDVIIQRWSTARLITLNTFIDGRFVHSQRSDGMIISTPTGSTAYALSGGGPILHPTLDVVVLVPICPHTLTNRPIVVASTSLIEVEIGVDRADDSRVTCDGNPLSMVKPGDRVHVTRHAQAVQLIHPSGHDHFATLRAKLHWAREPC